MNEDLDLVSIWYKCNRKQVLVFMFSKGSQTTATGEPNLATVSDLCGNMCIHHNAWPAVISRYFNHSNRVDVRNQAM